MTETSRTPALPVTRPTGGPFDPPADYVALRDTEPVRECAARPASTPG
ncbi:hypothetical protein OG203_17105 [Nocardia sp. NBC_01499]